MLIPTFALFDQNVKETLYKNFFVISQIIKPKMYGV